MPDPWMPGLIHDPGTGAGYNAGRNRMFMAVDHDTGGSNSYAICKNGRPGYDTGLCQILLPKVGIPWQFTEIDAICYHAGSAQYGDYNPYGPGFEVERFQGEELSPDQAHWLGRINAWCESEWGLPNVHYWGPRFPAWGANFHGHVNHRDIHPNPDGLSEPEWIRITAPIPDPTPKRKVNPKMWIAWLQDSNYCDVYYNGVLVDGFTNEGGQFGVGPKLQGYLDGGAGCTRYKDGAEYAGARDRLAKAAGLV
ncbi:MAG TPA: hypothetical protein VIY86_07055 [Pirellulaceae bacterium]